MEREQKTINVEINPDIVVRAILKEKLRQETGYVYRNIDESKLRKLNDNHYEYTFELPNIEDDIEPIKRIVDNYEKEITNREKQSFGIPYKPSLLTSKTVDQVDFYRVNQYRIDKPKSWTDDVINRYGDIIREGLKRYDEENPTTVIGHIKLWFRKRKI